MEDRLLFRTMTTRKLFWYPGSKSQGAPTILKRILERCGKEMVSPFFGSGAVELTVAACGVRVYGYDRIENLTNLWSFILSDAERLTDWCEQKLHSTPREKLSETFRNGLDQYSDFERAGYYYLWQALSFRGIIGKAGTLAKYGINENGDAFYKAACRRLTFFGPMRSFYSPNLSVGNADFEDSLNNHSEIFAYCDPPYPSDKKNFTLYDKEKTHLFDHERLARVLHQRNGNWLLSYNDHPLIHELYPQSEFQWYFQDWHQGNSVKKRATDEVLITRR